MRANLKSNTGCAWPCRRTRTSRHVQTIRVIAAGRQTTTTLADDLSGHRVADVSGQTTRDARAYGRARSGQIRRFSQGRREKQSHRLFVNLLSAATEAADTRSWVSLPAQRADRQAHATRRYYTLTLESLDSRGRVIEAGTISDIHIRPGTRTFVNYRTYK